LRIHNAKEFTAQEMVDFCSEKNIVWQAVVATIWQPVVATKTSFGNLYG